MSLSTSPKSNTAVTLQQLIEASGNDSYRGRKDRHSLAQVLTALISASSSQLPNLKTSVANIPFEQFRLDSRQLAANDVFVLLKSHTPNCQKSRDYLYQAAEQAAFILAEIDPIALLFTANVPPHANIELMDNAQALAQQQLAALPCPVLYVPNIRDFLGDLIQARLQY